MLSDAEERRLRERLEDDEADEDDDSEEEEEFQETMGDVSLDKLQSGLTDE